MKMHLTLSLVFLLSLTFAGHQGFAQSEEVDGPPTDSSISGEQYRYDPLKAEQEKYDPLRGEYEGRKNDSGIFLGVNTAFGQANSTEPDSTAGLYSVFGFEAGYAKSRGSWNRFEVGGKVIVGKANFRFDGAVGKIRSDLTLMPAVLAKVGYGYSLGDRLFGVFSIAAGPFFASFEGKEAGQSFESSDTLNGLILELGYHIAVPMGDTFELVGGLGLSHLQADVDEVDVDGTDVDFDRSIILNVPQITLGARLKL